MARAKLQLRPEPQPSASKPRGSKGITHKVSPARPPSRQGTKLIGGHFTHATWAALRRLGLDLDKSVQALLQEAIDDLLAKHRRPI